MAIPMEIIAHGGSDVGRSREHNEDAFLVDSEQRLYVVADGMGGHSAGEVAARLVVEELAGHFHVGEADEAPAALEAAVRAANAAVFQAARAESARRGMGSTVVALHADPRRVSIAHVGDSRAYLVRGERIQQLTEDHSLVNAQLQAGALTPEEAAASPHRNVILRAVGAAESVAVDVACFAPEPMDRVLLCSDGLSNLVPPAGIWEITTHAVTLRLAVRRLIEAANQAGGHDNITALIVQFVPRPRGVLHKLCWHFSRQVAK